MNIFLRRIPANTHHFEIADFIKPALQRGWLRKPGKILNIETLTLRDIRTDSIEYHALVTLDSAWAVQKSISELKNRRLNGRFVLIKPYYHRNWDNDPRQAQSKFDSELFIDRRKGDRRRGKYLEVIKNVSDHFNTQEDFIKSLNHQHYQISFIVPSEIADSVFKHLAEFGRKLGAEDSEEKSQMELIVQQLIVEKATGEINVRRIQFHASRPVITGVVELLKQQFSGQDITYWITPVAEFGLI